MHADQTLEPELFQEIRELKALLKRVAGAIDWDQQDASRFYIGEDEAEAVLARLGFPWERGLCNEEVERFLKDSK